MKPSLILILSLLMLTSTGCDRMKQSLQELKEKKQALKKTHNTPSEVTASLSPQHVEPLVIYYNDGTVKAERYFLNGMLHGSYKEFYQNGQLKTEGAYRQDKMNGIFNRYFEDGRLKARETYEDNILIHRETFPLD